MSAGFVTIAQYSSPCATCGQLVMPGDRIVLQGQGAGRQVGKSSHETCVRWNDGTDHNLPRLLWSQVEALRQAVHKLRLPDDNRVRRLIAAVNKRRNERATAFLKKDDDAALGLGIDLYEGYLVVLNLLKEKDHVAGDFWLPRQANAAPWRDHREIKAQGPIREEIRSFREREAQLWHPGPVKPK